MKNVEEYLYYNENQSYAYLKFVNCTYYQSKQKLLVRYIYAEEIEAQLPTLKKRLETLFMQQVGLPIKYEFVYKKVYADLLTLQLEIVSFLHRRLGTLSRGTTDENVQVKLLNNTLQINLFLPMSLIDFLQNSQQWHKFQKDLQNKSFYDFQFFMNPTA